MQAMLVVLLIVVSSCDLMVDSLACATGASQIYL